MCNACRYVQQILEVLKAFVAYAQSLLSDRKRGTKVVTVNDFLRECKIDNVNIFKLARYFDVSGISKKVNGLVLKLDEAGSMSPRKGTAPAAAAPAVSAAADEDYVAKHVSALKMTETFFSLLTNREKDGRLVLQGGKSMSDVSIKFLLLNPGVYFEDVLLKVWPCNRSPTLPESPFRFDPILNHFPVNAFDLFTTRRRIGRREQ